MTICKAFVIFAAVAVSVVAGQSADGQVSATDDGREVRLVSETSGAREDNNGGDPLDGPFGELYLIGDNATNTPNYLVYGFDLSPYAGMTTTGDATVVFSKLTVPQPLQSGGVEDLITLFQLAGNNSGWDEGIGEITFSDTPADDGSISFLNRAQFSGSGISEPWLDDAGNAVSNLTGAITPIASRPGYSFADPDGTEYTITIPQADAQRWLDDGIAGLVFAATDPNAGFSRFRISEDVSIRFQTATVPEPGGGMLLAVTALAALCPRRRK